MEEWEREPYTGRTERAIGQNYRIIDAQAPDRYYESRKDTEPKAEPLDWSSGRMKPCARRVCTLKGVADPVQSVPQSIIPRGEEGIGEVFRRE